MVASYRFTLTLVSSTPLVPTTAWSETLPRPLCVSMDGVTGCGFSVLRAAYTVRRGDTIAEPVTRCVGVTVQSARVYDWKLRSSVSLRSGGRSKTCVCVYSNCVDSSTLNE